MSADSGNELKYFNVCLDANNIREKGIEIVKAVRSEWNPDEVIAKPFTDGLTNILMGYYSKGNPRDIVLVRMNGEKSEVFIDREAELRIMIALHKFKFGPRVYCAFGNGICYGFENGEVLNKHQMYDPKISMKIAEKMAKMHTLKVDETREKEVEILEMTRKALALLPPNKVYSKPGSSMKEWCQKSLSEEAELVESKLSKFNSPIVFCHNDLLPENILYDRENDEIKFIDFEYAGYNYRSFDI
ncbi:ethanolamine kinase 1-like protein, partial [Dinothrombium tinctorium]